MRRLTSSLKEQHWVTIAIELIIVIIGVFIGTQVSNWNEQRAERRATARLLEACNRLSSCRLSAG